MGETFNPIIDSERTFIRYVAKKCLKQLIFKSGLVVGMTNFDYSVLFQLPRLQAINCYTHLFQSFSFRGWLAGLRNVHMDDTVEFVDELHQIFLESLVVGLVIDDMFRFCLIVLNSPKEKTRILFFNRIACAWVMCIHRCRQVDLVPLHEVWARLICLLCSRHFKVVFCRTKW